MATREERLAALAAEPSDMQGHVRWLVEQAGPGQRVVELGVRTGVSTRALLLGRPDSVLSIDLRPPPEELRRDAEAIGTPWRFLQANSLEVELPGRFELLLIDTLHTGPQLLAELNRHQRSVSLSGRIVLHDTETFGAAGEGGEPGLQSGLHQFLAAHPEWRIGQHFRHSHGLTVLERVPTSWPLVVGVCPTYRRPECLANVLACWEWQTYAGPRRLLILDDGGDFIDQAGKDWELRSVQRRFPSLAAKFNALLDWAGELGAVHVAVWEDDDGYLPWHLAATVDALQLGRWSHPSRSHVADTAGLRIEGMKGRGHAGWGYPLRLALEVGGYPNVDPGFDTAFGAKLDFERSADPYAERSPGYVYRWAVAGPYHGSALGQGFYGKIGDRFARHNGPGRPLVPGFDAHMQTVAKALGISVPGT